MAILGNTWVRDVRPDLLTWVYGAPDQAPRYVQLKMAEVGADPGMVEIMPGSSSAMAPMLKHTIYDWPDWSYPTGTGWQRADVCTIINGTFQPGTVSNANPFHVLKVQTPYGPYPAIEVSIGRMDFLWNAQVIWLPRIRPYALGAQPVPGEWDENLKQIVVKQSGLSLGTGWMGIDPVLGDMRYGYYHGVTVQMGVNEYSRTVLQEIEGYREYESPVIIYEPPLSPHYYKPTRGDLLIYDYGTPIERRLVVADVQHTFQRYGVALGELARVEERHRGDIVFTVTP